MVRRLALIGAALICAAPLTHRAGAGQDAASTTPPSTTPRIVNGVVTAEYPSAGALLSPNNPESASLVCSGTLIGCQTFLTAAHCVDTDTNPSHYTVFLQHAGFFSVASITARPDFDFPVGDVAIVKLAQPVTGIRPTAINTTATPSAGTAGTIVGFGRTGGFNTDYGIKRTGAVSIATCKNGISNTTSVCWDFTNPVGPPGTDSNTCNGDSGGPLFVDFGAGMRVAGVTSGGNAENCLPTDSSFDANVYFYRSWIQMQGGADLDSTACGDLPQVGDADTSVTALSGQLGSTGSATHSFTVPLGTTRLRIAMNGIDNGSDFDLFVKAGSPPSTTSFDCRRNGPGQYALCEFVNPTTGTWYALVDRAAGSGAYQLTVTTFAGGATCESPASNGQNCNDGNPCTQDDMCQGGTCVGTPVTNGTACDDGKPCTPTDTCQAGVCTGIAEPRTGCRAPFVSPSGLLKIEDTTPNNAAASDKITWNWWRGTATVKSEFGDPLTSTDYDLCVFDETSGTPALVLWEHVAAAAQCNGKPCWAERSKSFKYTDRKLENGPVSSVLLQEGTNGKAKITVKAKGTTLDLPALPLRQENTVTVQLSNGTLCWEGRYSTSARNDLYQFRAKAD
jgi:V8-like Glu-specific endopeptidase